MAEYSQHANAAADAGAFVDGFFRTEDLDGVRDFQADIARIYG